MDLEIDSSSEAAKRRQRALLAAIIGNALEWYDFIAYAFLAVFIAKKFFPPGDDTAALLATFATFALSFIVRPIGGILIGIYADRVGRRPALTFVMASMTVAMLIMVLVPSYATIGVAATVLMVIARLLQALSAGGEFASAATYLLESVPPNKRGLYSGLYSSGPQIAGLLVAVIGLTISEGMAPETRDSWGWRLPFVVGLLIAPVGYYIRRHLPETPAFQKAPHERRIGAKLAALFRENLGGIAIALALAAVANASAYVLLAYAPTYVVRTLKLPLYVPFTALLIASVIGTVFTPVAGALADRIGARRQFNIGVLALIVSIVPLYIWLSSQPSFEKLMVCAVVFAFITSLSGAVYPTLMAYLFPAETRATAMAISYNISATVFGGASLYYITLLIEKTGSSLVPAWYVLAIALVGFLLVNLFHERLGVYKV